MISIAQLEALTSAGVVRRADKALTKSDLVWTEKTDSSEQLWHFEFESYIGQLNVQNIQQSQCNCPASGLCKHLVAAALAYGKQAEQSTGEQTPSKAAFNPTIAMQDLCKQAGKAACRYAYQHFPSLINQVTLTKESDHHLLSWPSAKAIFGSGQGLGSITVEDGGTKEQLLAAVLYLAHNQQPLDWPAWLEQEKQAQIKAREQQLIQAKSQVKQQLIELGSIGVANLQPTNLIELGIMAQPLKSQGLNTIANGINSLIEWVNRRSEKLGLDPTKHLLRQIARLYAECDAKADTQTDTQSNTSSKSKQFDHLNLFCIGGHQWTTTSGSLGLSMVFICEQGKIYTATILRQQNHLFSPQNAWLQQNLWESAPLNYQLTSQYFSLANVKLNQWQSLSLSQQTRFTKQSSPAFEIKSIENWQDLKKVEVFGYALLSVKKWHDCRFDEATQKLTAQLQDCHGQLLLIEQNYHQTTEDRIVNLMDYWSDQPALILVRHTLLDDHHTFEPIAIYHNSWLSLDFKTADKSRKSLLARALARFKKSSKQNVPDKGDISTLLDTLETQLSQYPHHNQQQLTQLSERLQLLGLDVLRNQLELINKEPEAFLKLAYCVGALKTLVGGWPIYSVSSHN